MNLNLFIKDDEKTQINFQIYKSTHEELKALSKKYNTSITNLIIHAINTTIDELNKTH